MTDTKTEISDWKVFARHPTCPRDQPTDISSNQRLQNSTVFRETFVRKIINEKGEILSRTRCTEYTNGGGVELTKHDYDEAKAKDLEFMLEVSKRREWARGKGQAASQTTLRSSLQVNKRESEAMTSRPASKDDFCSFLETPPCQIKKNDSKSSMGQPTSDDLFPACWQPPPCIGSSPVSPTISRRSANLPPHLRSGPSIPPLLHGLSSYQGSMKIASAPPHLRNSPAFAP